MRIKFSAIPKRSLRTLIALLLLGLLAPGLTAAGDTVRSADGRYIDNGDETITDTKTGLMWMKKDSYLESGHWINWFEAFDYIKDLNERGYAGHYDWRLPIVKDLQTLYEADKVNSAQAGSEMTIHIDPVFAREGAGALWSLETNGSYNAFGVVFNTGNRFNSSKKSRSRKAVRAVREALQ